MSNAVSATMRASQHYCFFITAALLSCLNTASPLHSTAPDVYPFALSSHSLRVSIINVQCEWYFSQRNQQSLPGAGISPLTQRPGILPDSKLPRSQAAAPAAAEQGTGIRCVTSDITGDTEHAAAYY